MLISSMMAFSSLSSDVPDRRSRICCGVGPSGSIEGHRGIIVRKAFFTSTGEICSGENLRIHIVWHGDLLSAGAGGCLSWRAFNVSEVVHAGLPSEQMILTDVMKFHISSLLAIVETNRLFSLLPLL